MATYPFQGKKLMAPGPVPLSSAVKDSFSTIECHHRSKDFAVVLERVFAELKTVFQTQQHCYVLSATGTGGLEAAMVNTMETQRPFLSINAGKFGERWGKIAKAYGIAFDEIKVPWGEDISLQQVEDQLGKKNYQALAFQACETSTGALLPVEALAQLAQDFDVLSVVDGITALGAVNLPMDQWGLDVVVGGSQKAFMLPTGMCFLSLSERAERAQTDIKKYYFDLAAEKTANLQGKTRYSTPTQFIIGLNLVLEQINHQLGFDKHLQQVLQRAEFFREQVNLPLFPQTSSPSLSCLRLPEGAIASEITNKVEQQGFIIVGGQDQLKEKVIRVGHMGDMTEEDLRATAQAINNAL